MKMETLGSRLKFLRKDKKMTQQQLADEVGVSKTSVIYWEKDENIPKHESLILLSKVLKTSPDWLLSGKERTSINNFNMQEFMDKHGLSKGDQSSFDVNNIQSPVVAQYAEDDGFIWIDIVEASFSCGTGEAIEFHFDVINGKFPFPPSFFKTKHVHPDCMKIIKAKGDSMSDFIKDNDFVGIDISQTEIVDGEIYAVYFEGEGMIKQIFKEEGGKLILHSLNPKYRDREVTEQNGLNFRVMGHQFWRAG
ncbi:S24 family peptidase [Acinetobacter ursingii]|uniref:S24 family peptidase n=1 Tax=Acinetobacter ursingii TaxID=108980 RepID=UPI00300B4F0F